jgi:endonuclease/exonuclease/phosphatase family metal-dependent hydrolase
MIRGRALPLAMGALVMVAAGLPGAAVAAGPGPGAAGPVVALDDPDTLVVMSRNLYLGADVGVALELLPDLPAAAQFMWDQVAATDFDARVGLLAAEAAEARPHVIGLQEATQWLCTPGLFRGAEPVFDFTEQFLAATRAAGVPYVIAQAGDGRAENPGYSIPPIPGLTTVEDPDTFQPLFGSDTADCGFVIGDALLVREDVAGAVVAAGTSEYEERYPVVPVVFTIDRGYAWADLRLGGRTVRAVTTHLESLYPDEGVPPASEQARQLVADLSATTTPLVVMGDFNSDPRDPRASGAPNPASQPSQNAACPAQSAGAGATGDASCSAYWTMVTNGYADAGPDALDPANATWGSEGDLAGPNPERLAEALAAGNASGFTDRLDYVFLRNGVTASSARIIGNVWPEGEVWACDDPTQVATTEASSALQAQAGQGEAITGRGVCLPSDHAGVVVEVDLSAVQPVAGAGSAFPDEHDPLVRINLLGWLGIILGVLVVLVLLLVWGVWRLATRGRRRRRREAAAAS